MAGTRSAHVVLGSFTPQLHTWGLASSHPPLSPPSSLLEVKFLPPARPPSFLPLSKNSDSDLKGLEDSVGRVLASSMKTHVENIESLVKSFSIELLFVDSTVVLSRGELLFNFESS